MCSRPAGHDGLATALISGESSRVGDLADASKFHGPKRDPQHDGYDESKLDNGCPGSLPARVMTPVQICHEFNFPYLAILVDH